MSSLYGDHPQRALHRGIRHRDHASREIEKCPRPRTAAESAPRNLQETLESIFAGLWIKTKSPAQEMVGIKPAQEYMSIRDGRQLAPSTVAGGSGHGPRALRAHAQGSARVDSRQRPTT